MTALGPTWLCLHPAASKAGHRSVPHMPMCKALKPEAMCLVSSPLSTSNGTRGCPRCRHLRVNSHWLGGILWARHAISHIVSTSNQPLVCPFTDPDRGRSRGWRGGCDRTAFLF